MAVRALLVLVALVALLAARALYRDRARSKRAETRALTRNTRTHARKRVALLGKDPAWVNAVTDALEALGVEVALHTDIDTLDELVTFSPDAVVVRIEDLSPNGFHFVKHIKRLPVLRDAVLVVESRDPHAPEIFAQHRRLRTRADTYLLAEDGVGAVVAALRPHV
jgi:hypothetical protein